MPVLSALLLALLSAASTPADGFATVRVPAGQAAVVTLSLSPATAKLLGDTASVWLVGPTGVREVPSQYDAPDDGPTHLCWLRDDPATDETYRIRADAPSPGLEPPHRVTVQRESDALVVDTGALRLRHPLTAGGLPSSFSLPSLPAPVALSWSDRLYHFGLGGFNLTGDPSPEVQVRTAGPLRAEVQVSARYLAGDAPAPGRPHAVYTFAYTAASPVVELSVHVLSPADQVWHELHIAQLCGLPFQRFHAGEGCEPMPLTGRDYPVSNPSVLIGTGPTATVGLIQDPTANRSPDDFLAFWDPALPSDREAREGIVRTYVRGPWLGAWRGEYTHDLSIVFGPPNLPAAEARRLVRAVLSPTELSVSTPALEQALASVEDAVASAKPPGPDAGTSGARRDATSPAAWWWKAYLGGIAARGSGRARRMASRGCLVEAEEAARSTAERLARLARQAPRVQESSDAAAWAARSSGLLVLGSSRCATAIDLRRPPAIASLVARHGTQDLASAERRVPVLRVKLRRVDGSDFETATRDLRLESVTASISDEGVTGEIALRGLPEPGITLRATVAYHIARDGDATAWRASATADGATLLWLRFPDVAVAPVGGPEALGQQVVITPRALGTNLIPRPAESFSLAERQPFGDM